MKQLAGIIIKIAVVLLVVLGMTGCGKKGLPSPKHPFNSSISRHMG